MKRRRSSSDERDDTFDHRYSVSKPSRSPRPGGSISQLGQVADTPGEVRAAALRVLASHGALDLAEMLGLE